MAEEMSGWDALVAGASDFSDSAMNLFERYTTVTADPATSVTTGQTSNPATVPDSAATSTPAAKTMPLWVWVAAALAVLLILVLLILALK